MIAIDWGTTSLRAYRLRGRTVLERRDLALGITTVAPGGFDAALDTAVGDWIAEGERRVLLSGMVGSRQGWVEAPYLPCPAGLDDLAAALIPVPYPGADVRLVPGLTTTGPDGVPEVMRGEEVQVLGAGLDPAATACLPGSHSKWVALRDGRIDGFTTHLTGEAFAALRGHTILGRLMQEGAAHDPDAFRHGVLRSAAPGGLLHHLFGVRTLGLFAQLTEDTAPSYLSGLLIGHEVRAANPGGLVQLIGAGPLCERYAEAIGLCGGTAVLADPDAAAHGLANIAERAPW